MTRAVTVRPVPESDLPALHRLWNERLGDVAAETVRDLYGGSPDLFVGAYDDELVGFACGPGQGEAVVELRGIVVRPAYRRRGIGSRLLDAFETRAADAGAARVTLGSAGGYVDEFYLANGYEPASILVRLDAVPDDDRDRGFDIVEARTEDGVHKLYVGVDGHDPDYLQAVREAFDDPEAIYIVEKQLDG